MSKQFDLYKCNICGNIVEVVISGVGELVCCGELMHHLDAKSQDAEYEEKHVPFVSFNEDGIEIRVGSELHPMLENHYIQFIEAISADKSRITRQYLHFNQSPIVKINEISGIKKAREYCNIHGLWENEV